MVQVSPKGNKVRPPLLLGVRVARLVKLRSCRHRAGAKELSAGQFHLNGSSLAIRKQKPPPRCFGGVRAARLDKLRSWRHRAGANELSAGQFYLDGSSLAIRKQNPTPPQLRGCGVLVRVARLELAASWSQTYRENFFCSFIAVFSRFLFVLLTL